MNKIEFEKLANTYKNQINKNFNDFEEYSTYVEFWDEDYNATTQDYLDKYYEDFELNGIFEYDIDTDLENIEIEFVFGKLKLKEGDNEIYFEVYFNNELNKYQLI